MEKKITHKMIYEAIKAMAEDGNMHIEDFCEGLTDEMVAEFCGKEIEKIDKKNSKARETAEKKRTEDELLEVVRGLLTDEFQSIMEITSQINDEEVSTSKVQYRLGVLAKEGYAEKKSTTVDKRQVMTYRKA